MVEQFLGQARPQIWGSDAFPTQLSAPAAKHRLWLSHRIRDLTNAIEVNGPSAR